MATHSLSKRCNTAEEHHRDALRVSLSMPRDGVAPLEKGAAIACELRLAVNVDKLTESANIASVDYQASVDAGSGWFSDNINWWAPPVKNITIIEGDITRAHVDAIVNAANPHMLGGGGVDGAIHRAAGPQLLAECRKVMQVNGVRCPFGQARMTPAGALPAKYVIHTVGPIYEREKNPQSVLESAYFNSLSLALANKCQSLAFPAISCGVYGYPPRQAAAVALAICNRPSFRELAIWFYLFGAEMTAIWQAEFDKISAQG